MEEDARLQEAMAMIEQHEYVLEAKKRDASAACAIQEDRLRALAMEREQLLTGMKDKLPAGYHPLGFQFQGDRANPIYAPTAPTENLKGCDGSQRPTSMNTEHAGVASAQPMSPRGSKKFQPAARPSRMQGVGETREVNNASLRAQGNVQPSQSRMEAKTTLQSPRGQAPSAKPHTSAVPATRVPTSARHQRPTSAGPSSRAAVYGQATPQRSSRPVTAAPRDKVGTTGQLASPRLSENAAKAVRPVRPSSGGPSSRTAAYGQGSVGTTGSGGRWK